MIDSIGPITGAAGPFIASLALACLVIFTGCDTSAVTDPPDQQIDRIMLLPETATLGIGEQVEFSAVALNADGEIIDTPDLVIEWEWWSSDPDVFTVTADGVATGVSPGEEFCIVEATLLPGSLSPDDRSRIESSRIFTGRDSAVVMVF